MAESIVPSEISSNLSADGGLGNIFTNVYDVVQTVGSIYDQISGKSQSVPGQAGQTYSQSPTVAVPVPAPAKASEPMFSNSGIALGFGAVVLIGALLLLKN